MGLLKFLNNKSDEEQKLYEWLDDTSQNHSAIKAMLATDSMDLSILKDYKQFDTNSAWDRLSAEVDLDEAPVVKHNFKTLYKVAAVGAVLLASVFAFNNLSNNNADSELAMITVGDDMMKQVELPDGSLVHIDKQGAISFDEGDFMQTRKVELTGRAFFEVTKVEGKNFVISADGVNVEVLGTKFEVNAKSEIKSVTVEEGKVRVYNNSSEVELTANEKALINGIQITETLDNSNNTLSWKDGLLSFEDAEMQVVLSDLADHFTIDIGVDESSSNLDNCRLSTSFKNQDLESILKELNQTTGANYKIEKNKVYISDLCK